MDGLSVAMPGLDRRVRRGEGRGERGGDAGGRGRVELARDGHRNNKGQRGR